MNYNKIKSVNFIFLNSYFFFKKLNELLRLNYMNICIQNQCNYNILIFNRERTEIYTKRTKPYYTLNVALYNACIRILYLLVLHNKVFYSSSPNLFIIKINIVKRTY